MIFLLQCLNLHGKNNFKLFYRLKKKLLMYNELNNININTTINNIQSIQQENVIFDHYNFLNLIERNYIDVTKNSY